eukprot:m.191036 g.191036  ORF g.191036 m.191036 type:complete len:212 (+) comp16760_c0_seq21:3129-3764(+)
MTFDEHVEAARTYVASNVVAPAAEGNIYVRVRHVLWLIKLLATKLDACSSDRVLPIHGPLESIRHLLLVEPFVDTAEQDVSDLDQQKLWSAVVFMLWSELERVVSYTLPTVASSAPEGHTGGEEDTEGSADLAASSETFEQDMVAKTHLVCCWRAMKEVAYIKALIVLRFPFLDDGEIVFFLFFFLMQQAETAPVGRNEQYHGNTISQNWF